MNKYVSIVLEMYFKGCSVVQAIGIVEDIMKMEEKNARKES
jgi:hypothetical protein